MASPYSIQRVAVNVPAATTDSVVLAAVAGKSLRVLGATLVAGATATDITFNTKPAGAGSAISALFALAIRAVLPLPESQNGWFQTAVGEGLTATTGAGATTGIQLIVAVV